MILNVFADHNKQIEALIGKEFGWDYDFFGDGTKARRLGFHEFVDAGQMFFELFGELKSQKSDTIVIW